MHLEEQSQNGLFSEALPVDEFVKVGIPRIRHSGSESGFRETGIQIFFNGSPLPRETILDPAFAG
jgi:hypothetical protein